MELSLFDSHCPHLGANIGRGGWIANDCVVCPFHGWSWDSEGRNRNIPYAPRPNLALRLKKWHVQESGGLVLMWHDTAGGEPLWDVPILPEADSENYYPADEAARRIWRNHTFPPQVMIENLGDLAHFEFVHRAPKAPEVLRYEEAGSAVRIDTRYYYPKGGEGSREPGVGEGTMSSEANGVGLLMARLSGGIEPTSHMSAITPIDDDQSDMRATVWVHRYRSGSPVDMGRRESILRAQFAAAEPDINIWDNLQFMSRPPLTPSESRLITRLRRWSSQFYGERPSIVSNGSLGAPTGSGSVGSGEAAVEARLSGEIPRNWHVETGAERA